MKSTEEKSARIERASMHDFFLKRINISIENKEYIEASWLEYACLENRYFRTIEKLKQQCNYSNRKCKSDDNQLALTTKIGCLQRLYTAECSCIKEAFDSALFDETKRWVKSRNILVHNLLRLEFYESMDENFKVCALQGRDLVERTYKCCTKFRKLFYDEKYNFSFPEEAMEKCPCKPRTN